MSKSKEYLEAETVELIFDVMVKAYRRGIAEQYLAMMVPHLVYNRGMGKSPAEFKPGSINLLVSKLDEFVETGVFPR